MQCSTTGQTSFQSLVQSTFVRFVRRGADHAAVLPFGLAPGVHAVTTQAVENEHAKQHDGWVDVDDSNVFKYVKIGEKQYYVPNLQNIQTQLGL